MNETEEKEVAIKAENENAENTEETEESINEPEKKKSFAEQLFEWVEIFFTAWICIILVMTFIGRHVTVNGQSMEMTLHDGERLIISNFLYKPKQNDIVVIYVPGIDTPIIKRVIATEGQTVDFDFENWQVIVDGEALDEPYVNYVSGVPMNAVHVHGIYNLPLTVEKDKVFVLGDNRNNSRDSRDNSIGQVPIRNIAGRVLIRFAPFEKFGTVEPVSQND